MVAIDDDPIREARDASVALIEHVRDALEQMPAAMGPPQSSGSCYVRSPCYAAADKPLTREALQDLERALERAAQLVAVIRDAMNEDLGLEEVRRQLHARIRKITGR